MARPSILRRLLRPLIRRPGLIADERGVSAIEFGILAVPFFAIIGAILETSMVFLAGQVLDSAVNDAARKIRTGEAQGASFNVELFRDEVCRGLYNLFDCTQVKVRVTTIGSFGGTAAGLITAPLKPQPCVPAEDATQCWNFPEVFTPGNGDEIALIQVLYRWPIIINFGGLNLRTYGDGTRLLSAVRVFQNEPFG